MRVKARCAYHDRPLRLFDGRNTFILRTSNEGEFAMTFDDYVFYCQPDNNDCYESWEYEIINVDKIIKESLAMQ